MAEQSGFFDAHLVNGEYDRVYLAEHFAKYFASFIGNGIFGGKSNELMVRAKEPASMGVRVLSGQAWIDGYWYENDDEHSLTFDIADGVLHRIDSVVVRWNNLDRTIRLAVKKGVAATNPIAPTVQRDDDYYELKLADIYIKAGTTQITQTNITDKRLNTSECGLVIGVVQQLDADEFGIQLEAYISEFIAQHDAWKNATQSDINAWSSNFKTSCINWFNQLKTDTNTSVSNLLTENQAKINKLLSDGQTNIDNVASTGEAKLNKTASDGAASIQSVVTTGQQSINNVVSKGTTDISNLITGKTQEIDEVISSGQQRFNAAVEELEEFAESNDLTSLVRDVGTLKTDTSTLKTDVSTLKTDVSNLKTDNTNTKKNVETLKTDVSTLKGNITELQSSTTTNNEKIEELKKLLMESTQYPGCYYRIINGNTEWINPPSMPGFEYMLTERWNGNPVYQKILNVGALSNKTMMSIEIGAEYDKIISVEGYAYDPENNMSYPFPIILNGLTPIAVISGIEGNGLVSYILINVNENLSAFSANITVKYTKN